MVSARYLPLIHGENSCLEMMILMVEYMIRMARGSRDLHVSLAALRDTK